MNAYTKEPVDISPFTGIKSSLDKLLKLQKRGLRFIYISNRNEHAIPLFVDANILPLTFSY